MTIFLHPIIKCLFLFNDLSAHKLLILPFNKRVTGEKHGFVEILRVPLDHMCVLHEISYAFSLTTAIHFEILI